MPIPSFLDLWPLEFSFSLLRCDAKRDAKGRTMLAFQRQGPIELVCQRVDQL